MTHILYPIHIDQWRRPIASKMREVATRITDMDFYTFSRPASEEDRILGQSFWAYPHIHRIKAVDVLRRRYDIVHHASATKANLTAALLAKARGRGKTVHIFAASVQPHDDDCYYREYVKSIKVADVVLAVSQVVAEDVKKYLGREVDAVIPNGVNLDFFSPETAQPLNLEKLGIRKPYVLFVAALMRRKRPDLFIKLAALLPDVDFVMIGRPPQTQKDRVYLQVAARQPNVKYLELRLKQEVRNLMAQASALVFPSEIEGMPNVVLEASAMGLPVLTQPKGPLPEIITEGVNGWLLPEEPLDAWAQKIENLLAWSDDKRSNFRTEARELMASRYSWTRIAEQYKELYKRLSQG